MPRRERCRFVPLALAVLAGVVLTAGCNRLTFVRPDFDRRGYEKVSRDIEVSDRGRERGSAASTRHVLLAREWLARGDAAKARSEAEAALKLDPRSVDAHTLLGAAFELTGESTRSGEHYQRAVDLAPQSGNALNNYGIWLCGSGQPGESLAWFERALAAPGYATPATALANAGACADRAGQSARAERDLRRAIALDPANAIALGALAEHELRAGRAFQARAFAERRLAAAPADRKSLFIASQIEEKLGDTAAAARYVQRMRSEFPDARSSGTGDNGKP